MTSISALKPGDTVVVHQQGATRPYRLAIVDHVGPRHIRLIGSATLYRRESGYQASASRWDQECLRIGPDAELKARRCALEFDISQINHKKVPIDRPFIEALREIAERGQQLLVDAGEWDVPTD
jgi:hypothetical protein